MNLLKNLLIIAVLMAVGYGMYVALQRSNADPRQPPGVADAWPAAPKVELSGVGQSPSPGGPLALSGSPAQPTAAPGFGASGTALPSASTSAAHPAEYPPSGVPAAIPYPSAAPSTGYSPTASSSPTATLGAPMSPEAISTMTMPNAVTHAQGSPAMSPQGQMPPSNTVRNLVPPPEATVARDAVSPVVNANDQLLRNKFAVFMNAVQQKLAEGKLAEAHLALSKLYANPDLQPDQTKQINDLLDQIAGTVIYSRQHHLEPPYVTRQGDTLENVAQKYSVPWQLLARINGLMPSGAPNDAGDTKDQPLPLGMELKVVRGPFDAVVDLDRHELTLMLNERYAGRFRIGVGRDQPLLDGNYTVQDKTLNPAYRGANDPNSPPSGAWIGLGDRIGIHGVSDPQGIGRDDNRGAICVGDRDLQDLYGILSVGSRVTIRR